MKQIKEKWHEMKTKEKKRKRKIPDSEWRRKRIAEKGRCEENPSDDEAQMKRKTKTTSSKGASMENLIFFFNFFFCGAKRSLELRSDVDSFGFGVPYYFLFFNNYYFSLFCLFWYFLLRRTICFFFILWKLLIIFWISLIFIQKEKLPIILGRTNY